MNDERRLGGCLCGAVRYTALGRPASVNLCHCRMCRKASGAPVVAWATYGVAKVRFEGVPAWRRSSDRAERAFCPHCGAAIAWRALADPANIDLTVGTFDEPDDLKPIDHLWMDARIKWLRIDDNLPKYNEGRESGTVAG